MMSVSHLVDFYYLELLRKEAADAGWTRIQEKADELFNELVDSLAESMMSYLFVASMGEARHASRELTESYFSPDLVPEQGDFPERSDIYQFAHEYDPRSNLPILKTLFEQKWHAGYGGVRWKEIVEAIDMYWTKPPAAFIDHVVDLQHNNGTAFSKPTAQYIGFSTKELDVHSFLNHKFLYNLIYRPNTMWPLTKRVLSLVMEARARIAEADKDKDLGERRMRTNWEHYTETTNTLEWKWKPIEWGDKVLRIQHKWKPFTATYTENGVPLSEVAKMLRPYIKATANEYLYSLATLEELEQLDESFANRSAVLKGIQQVWNVTRPYDGKGFDLLVKQNEQDIRVLVERHKRFKTLRKKEVMT